MIEEEVLKYAHQILLIEEIILYEDLSKADIDLLYHLAEHHAPVAYYLLGIYHAKNDKVDEANKYFDLYINNANEEQIFSAATNMLMHDKYKQYSFKLLHFLESKNYIAAIKLLDRIK